MAITIGMGDFVYEYEPDWAKLPAGIHFQNPSAVAVDSNDRVYVFQRLGSPVMVFGPDGEFLSGWPRRDGLPEDAHHIYIGPDDSVYLTDRDAHQVLKCTTDGEVLMALGNRYRAALQAPFNHPSDIAVGPSGEIYVSDGYGNSSVHRFTASGEYIGSFGSPGSGPGEFRVPHSIRVANDGRIYVCDRGKPPSAGVQQRRFVPGAMDRLQVAHGGAHRRQPDGLRHRPGAPAQHPHAGWRAGGSGGAPSRTATTCTPTPRETFTRWIRPVSGCNGSPRCSERRLKQKVPLTL